MGRGGDGFYLLCPRFSYTYHYFIHTQWEWETKSPPHPWWVRVSPSHPPTHIESFFNNSFVFLFWWQCCNALSSNMLTLTFFFSYNIAIIKHLGTGLSMNSGWERISMLFILYMCFEIGKNPNSIKVEKIYQIGLGSGRYLQGSGFVVMSRCNGRTF